MTHSEAVALMVANLPESVVAAPEIQLALSLARLLDENPFAEPEIYREYRFALKRVKEVLAGDDDVDQELADLLARLGDSDVRDASKS